MLIQNKNGKMAYVKLEKKNVTGAQVVRHKAMMLVPKNANQKFTSWQSPAKEERKYKAAG